MAVWLELQSNLQLPATCAYPEDAQSGQVVKHGQLLLVQGVGPLSKGTENTEARGYFFETLGKFEA